MNIRNIITTSALVVLLGLSGGSAYADGGVVDTIKENPGTSAGVVGCAAVLIFPPSAIWCAATLVGGAAVDGVAQDLVKKAVK